MIKLHNKDDRAPILYVNPDHIVYMSPEEDFGTVIISTKSVERVSESPEEVDIAIDNDYAYRYRCNHND